MSLIAAPDVVDVVDKDLLDKIEQARGTSGYQFTILACKAEQERRNAIAGNSRDRRRRLPMRVDVIDWHELGDEFRALIEPDLEPVPSLTAESA